MQYYPKISAKLKFKQLVAHVEYLTDVIEPNQASSSSSSSSSSSNSDCSALDKQNLKREEKHFMWRSLIAHFPLKWALNFEKPEFARFRIENQGSVSSGSEANNRAMNDQTPFAKIADCKGPVMNMVCASSSRNDKLNSSGGMEEERMGRSQLCKDCYWFMSSINVLMEIHELPSDCSSDGSDSSGDNRRVLLNRNLKKYVNQLPNSYNIFVKEIKPKYFWQQYLNLFDRVKALRELSVGVATKCTAEGEV